jgi:hypothetical protein
VNFGGMAFSRFRDGRMIGEWSVHDNLVLLRQLDVLPLFPDPGHPDENPR